MLRISLILVSLFSMIAAQFPTDMDYGLLQIQSGRMLQVSSYDRSGGNHDYQGIYPNQTLVLAELDGPGIIRRIWMTLSSPDSHYLRKVLIRAYWDDEPEPSIEVPLGDFFGTGMAYCHYETPYLGMSSGGFYCYLPMPFRHKARLEIVNQTDGTIPSFYYQVGYLKPDSMLNDDMAYFHACWHRDLRPDSGCSYTILEAVGHGHLIGMNLSVQGYTKNWYFLEGDEQIRVDGEKNPGIIGTGTEDYFNSGWYFNQGIFASAFHGLLLKDNASRRIAAYRFHIPDPVPFKKSILFQIEHGPENDETADYSSTAYWYQNEPHQTFPIIPKPSMRIPLQVVVPLGALEAESLHPIGNDILTSVIDMTDWGSDWSDGKQLRIESQSGKPSFELPISDLPEEAYQIDLYVTRGPEYGHCRISASRELVGEFEAYAKRIVPGGAVCLKAIKPEMGRIVLRFESDSVIGLDALVLNPVRRFIPEWQVIGPFPNPEDSSGSRIGLNTVYPPELGIDLDQNYPGAENKRVNWRTMSPDSLGKLSFYQCFEPNENVVMYAVCWVFSPDDRTATLFTGSDDGIKVFINDQAVFLRSVLRISEMDKDRILIHLHSGWNKVLLKIENHLGGFSFFARIVDGHRELKFCSHPPMK
ncbi:MAG: DUF2961 domain-containing protein [Candidatus Delongbacteria bacterium]|nr:DUF2961 domain-containing protein [Candidatus Delongbacteria bacterium]